MVKEILHVQRCNSVDEFLSHLSPRNPSWGNDPNSWIFRGQADANWKLIPKILRTAECGKPEWEIRASNVRVRRRVLDTLTPPSPGHERLSVEWALVDEFLRAADAEGLHISEDTQMRRNVIKVHETMLHVGQGKGSWPPTSWLSAVALAQHYGVPTRLLDWSYKSKIAAYFACIDIAKEKVKSDELAVWALNAPVLELGTPLLQYQERAALITAPYDGNSNLAAQSGVFTTDYDAHDASRPFELFLEEHFLQAFGAGSDWTANYLGNWGIAERPFRKFVLPSKHAPELVRNLANERISAATIFPGYAGVYESLVEHRYWDKRPWDEPAHV